MMQQENQIVMNYVEAILDSPFLMYAFIPMKDDELPRSYPALYPKYSEPDISES